VLRELACRPFIDHDGKDGAAFWHGRLPTTSGAAAAASLQLPKLIWKCPNKPRDDHDDVPSWLTASEYEDCPDVLEAKLDTLVGLLSVSGKTVVYSGAGISRAAGIGQAARGRPAGKGHVDKTTTATPTATHFALTALHQRNLIHSWVQQNHDGLPQKAGFHPIPSCCILEI